MMEQDAAPAGGRRTLLPRSGGAGTPPGGTTTPCEELADGGPLGLPEALRQGLPKGTSVERAGGEAKRSVRKRGPALYGRRDGAPRGATPSREGVTKTKCRAHRRAIPSTFCRGSTPPDPLFGGTEGEYGVPGAFKEYGR
jgi:hypothetical protein